MCAYSSIHHSMEKQNITNQSTTNSVKQQSFSNNTLSDLYISCREGDYVLTLALLETLEFSQINRLEPNGSTALHVAAALGHAEITSLLLHVYGVMSDQKDQNNRTAYDIACNEEIRQLFHRPKNNNRFYSNDKNISANLFSIQYTEPRSDRVRRYENVYEVRTKQLETVRKQVKSPGELVTSIFKPLFYSPKQSKETLWATNLLSIIKEQVDPSHNQYQKACELTQRYTETTKIEPLLHLYTLETSFYRYLTNGKDSSNCLAKPLLHSLDTVRSRAFQGHSFRGLSMTHNDLQVYDWAHQHKNSYLEMNTFCSTSVDKNIADFYMKASENEDNINVFMEFSFSKICSTAIQLYAISPDLPCISNFENEKEVLIIPGTIFRVENIETNGDNVKIILDHYNMEDDIDEYRLALYDHNLPDW